MLCAVTVFCVGPISMRSMSGAGCSESMKKVTWLLVPARKPLSGRPTAETLFHAPVGGNNRGKTWEAPPLTPM
jgi:hypothetical protein